MLCALGVKGLLILASLFLYPLPPHQDLDVWMYHSAQKHVLLTYVKCEMPWEGKNV